MKKNLIFVIVIVLILAGTIIMGFGTTEKKREEDLLNIEYNITGNTTTLKYDTKNPLVAMYIEGYGSIVIELYPDIAPNTVNNFILLVKNGFYDNNTFHRLVKGFVLQGGDPTGTGNGGPSYRIKGEFTNNGFKNDLSHKKTIVSMARATDYDSAGSQFFICIDDAVSLDGDYAAFGKVIDGWDNIEAIVARETILDKSSGKLVNNLVLKKALLDLKSYKAKDVVKIKE